MSRGQLPGRFYTLGRAERRRLGILALVRIFVTAALLLGLYALAPTDVRDVDATILKFAIALAIVGVVVTIQVRAILSASYPLLRAVESVVTAILVFVIVFSLVYLDLAQINPGYFTERLDHVSALYFTVTVLTTVGFGDIAAKTDLSRAVVTIQMLSDLIFLAIVIRVFFYAAQSRANDERDEPAPQQPQPDGPS
jgi:voltage-gated potassium channel